MKLLKKTYSPMLNITLTNLEYGKYFRFCKVNGDKNLNVKSPYEKIYKTWLFRWIVYNKNLSFTKKEFTEHKLWKQHSMVIFSVSTVIGTLIFIAYYLFL